MRHSLLDPAVGRLIEGSNLKQNLQAECTLYFEVRGKQVERMSSFSCITRLMNEQQVSGSTSHKKTQDEAHHCFPQGPTARQIIHGHLFGFGFNNGDLPPNRKYFHGQTKGFACLHTGVGCLNLHSFRLQSKLLQLNKLATEEFETHQFD